MNRRDFIAGAVGGFIVGAGVGYAIGKGKSAPTETQTSSINGTSPPAPTIANELSERISAAS